MSIIEKNKIFSRASTRAHMNKHVKENKNEDIEEIRFDDINSRNYN